VSPFYKIPQKSLPGRQFTGKNPPHPAAARAEGFFAGKLSVGETFLRGERFYNGTPTSLRPRIFMGRRRTATIVRPREKMTTTTTTMAPLKRKTRDGRIHCVHSAGAAISHSRPDIEFVSS